MRSVRSMLGSVRVRLGAAAAVVVVLAGVVVVSLQDSGTDDPPGSDQPQRLVAPAAQHDTSAALRTLPPLHPPPRPVTRDDEEEDHAPGAEERRRQRENAEPVEDTVAQTEAGTAAAPPVSANFEGLGAGFPTGVYSYPPDVAAAVGTTQVAEVVNSSFAVFSKTGTKLYGPVTTNTIFSGFGGQCEARNDGDATIRFDGMANRWVLTQFSYFTSPYGVCVAVSATADATGSWHRYFFTTPVPPDAPKLGIWPDAYYVTINAFYDPNFAPVCALDRAKMLLGQPATWQCLFTNHSGPAPFPADMDGTNPPPAGAPHLTIGPGTPTNDGMQFYKFHVDWTTPANSTLTGPINVPVAPWNHPFTVPQPGTSNTVAAQPSNYRLAYRNLGDHESFVYSHAVEVNGLSAARWYEFRLSSGDPTVFQQGTYAPADGVHRWMSTTAMDGAGNIAVGYNAGNGTTLSPGLRFAGRLASDPAGQLSQGEGTIITGHGAQTGTSRWGDYATMNVDPTDDCTFWFAGEYINEVTSFGWRTRIASFRFPTCTAAPN